MMVEEEGSCCLGCGDCDSDRNGYVRVHRVVRVVVVSLICFGDVVVVGILLPPSRVEEGRRQVASEICFEPIYA